ncbi:MAG: transposase [Burkholderiales bacterium]|jgi:transposase-like protein|nr:transposase [Burkholderiales bacterium]
MAHKTTYENGFKAKVALEAVRGDKTIGEIATEYNVASSLVSKWKSELLANASAAFGAPKQKSPEESEHKLYQQIGKLTMEVDYLKKFVSKYR